MSPQARSVAAVAEIAEAARRRFGDQGYDATSMDEIAADANRTKGAAYHHFPDKRALFDHVLAIEQREIAEIVARSSTLPDGVDAYLRAIASRPRAARIMLIDGPTVLGWDRWRACDGGPFRSMMRASLDTYGSLATRHDLDLLTEVLLGAVTEAAQQVVASADRLAAAGRFGAELRVVLDSVLGSPPPERRRVSRRER